MLATIVIVLPLGVGAAIYLTEYAKNKKLVAIIEYAAETLSGIPSIIYGLAGMLIFCEVLGMGTSLLAGALTLAVMNLPTDPAHDAGEPQDRSRRATARARSDSARASGAWCARSCFPAASTA